MISNNYLKIKRLKIYVQFETNFFPPGIVSAYLPLEGGCIPYFLVLLTFFLMKPGDITVRTESLVK